jgi:hypothetical protein
LAAVTPDATVGVVVVVISVSAGTVFTVGAIVVSLAAAPLSQGVWLPVAPQELPAWLPVGVVISSSVSSMEGSSMEGEVLHHVQVDVQPKDVTPLAASWWGVVVLCRVVVVLVLIPVRIRDRQHHPLWDLTWVGGPRPKVISPRAVLPTSVTLDVVDGAGGANDPRRHLLGPGMDRHPLNAQTNAKLQLALRSATTLRPPLEVEHPAAVPHHAVMQGVVARSTVGEEDEVLLGEVLDHPEPPAVDAQLLL